MGASSKYLVIYHAISAGQNGPNLGCDEEEIVMILYLVLNVAENKVSFIHLNPSTSSINSDINGLERHIFYIIFVVVVVCPNWEKLNEPRMLDHLVWGL